MSDTYIPAKLRRQVIVRAKQRCEYCSIAEADTFLGCEVDHIVSEKHGGPTDASNLALACVICNRAKGSNIATVGEDGGLIQLFNPRLHVWSNHFARDGVRIIGKLRLDGLRYACSNSTIPIGSRSEMLIAVRTNNPSPSNFNFWIRSVLRIAC